MTTYQLTGEGYVVKDGRTTVPTAGPADLLEQNPDYRAYCTWLDAGGVPLPPAALPVPEVVSMRQARRALNSVGLLGDVEAVVATRPKDDQIEWEFATEVRRDYPLLAAVQVAAGLTDAQVDDLFRLASTF